MDNLDAAQVRELIAEGRERECPDDECNCGGYTTMRLCDALESALGEVERLEGAIAEEMRWMTGSTDHPAQALTDLRSRLARIVGFRVDILGNRTPLIGEQHHG